MNHTVKYFVSKLDADGEPYDTEEYFGLGPAEAKKLHLTLTMHKVRIERVTLNADGKVVNKEDLT